MSKELLEDAKEEWLERGYDPVEFELDKMLEIWKEEEDEQLKKKMDRRGNMLDDKMEIILSKGPEFDAKGWVKSGVSSFWKDVKSEIKAIGADIATTLETPMQRRARLKRAFLDQMNSERNTHQKFVEKQREKALHRKNLVETKKRDALRIKKQMIDLKEHEKTEKAKIDKANAEEKRLEAEAAKSLRVKELARVIKLRNVERSRRETEARREEHAGRKAASQTWAKHAKRMARESQYRIQQIDLRKARLLEEEESRWDTEKRQHIEQLARNERWEPELEGGVGGVYSIPLQPGEFKCPVPDVGGHIEGMDESTVDLSTGVRYTVNEEHRLVSYDLDGRCQKLAQRLKHLIEKSSNTKSNSLLVSEQRLKLKDDIAEVDRVEYMLQKELRGPPARQPTDQEKHQCYLRKRRKAILHKRLIHLQKEEVRVENAKRNLEIEKTRLQVELSRTKTEARKQKLLVDKLEKEEPSLPMIIGRGLGALAADEAIQNPTEILWDTTMRTKVAVAHEAGKVLQELGNDTRVLDHRIWAEKREIRAASEVYHRSNVRMHEIERGIKKLDWQNRQQELIEGLKRFFKSPTNLHELDKTFNVPVNWWSHIMRSQSPGAEDFKGVGTRLGDVSRGKITGQMKLPKYGKWRVTFVVGKPRPSAEDQGDSNDFIVINMGAALGNLEEIGKVYNKPRPQKTQIRWTVEHEFLGDGLAYEIIFFTSSDNADNHLLIMNGECQELVTPPITWEQHMLPSGVIDSVALSDYVLGIRMEKQNPTNRYIRLLEEMGKVQAIIEKNKASELGFGVRKFYDTDIIHGSYQRYHLEDCVNKLQYEITIEEARMKEEETLQGENTATFLLANIEDLTPEERRDRKVYLAKKRWIERKQGANNVSIEDAEKLCGKSLEIFLDNRWVFCRVLEYVIQWRGGSRWIDLSFFKFYVMKNSSAEVLIAKKEAEAREEAKKRELDAQDDEFDKAEDEIKSKQDLELYESRFTFVKHMSEGVSSLVAATFVEADELPDKDEAIKGDIEIVAYSLREEYRRAATSKKKAEEYKRRKKKMEKKNKGGFEMANFLVFNNITPQNWKVDTGIKKHFAFVLTSFLDLKIPQFEFGDITCVHGRTVLKNQSIMAFKLVLSKHDMHRRDDILEKFKSLVSKDGKNKAKFIEAFTKRLFKRNPLSQIRGLNIDIDLGLPTSTTGPTRAELMLKEEEKYEAAEEAKRQELYADPIVPDHIGIDGKPKYERLKELFIKLVDDRSPEEKTQSPKMPVPKESIRFVGEGNHAVMDVDPWSVGLRCQGREYGKGRWRLGKISKVHFDGTYTVLYDPPHKMIEKGINAKKAVNRAIRRIKVNRMLKQEKKNWIKEQKQEAKRLEEEERNKRMRAAGVSITNDEKQEEEVKRSGALRGALVAARLALKLRAKFKKKKVISETEAQKKAKLKQLLENLINGEILRNSKFPRLSEYLRKNVAAQNEKKLQEIKPVRKGIFLSEEPSLEFYMKEAKHIFIEKYVKYRTQFIVRDWCRQWRIHEKTLIRQIRVQAREKRARVRKFKRWQKRQQRKNMKEYFKEKKLERSTSGELYIHGLKEFLSPSGCEHLHVKYWGTMYDKGYYCSTCGREMSWSHEDPHQQLGYGAEGSWPPLITDAQKSARSLALLKEEHLISKTNLTFHDFKHGKKSFELNMRHGLEVDEKGDTPRLRHEFLLRKGHFLRVLGTFFKIGKARCLVNTLKMKNEEMRGEKSMRLKELSIKHKQMLILEKKQETLDEEHVRLMEMVRKLQHYETKKKIVDRALALAESNFEIATDVQEKSFIHNKDTHALHEAVTSLMEYALQLRRRQKSNSLEQTERAKQLRKDLITVTGQLRKIEDELTRRLYLQPGLLVHTPFGDGRVLDWRRKPKPGEFWPPIRAHNFVEVHISWSKMGEARMFIQPDRAVEYVRRWQIAETKSMQLEDELSRKFYKAESELMKVEQKKMEAEETNKRWIDDLQKLNVNEKLEYAYALISSEYNARLILQTDEKQEEFKEIAEQSVEMQIEDRRVERENWDNAFGVKPEMYDEEDTKVLISEEMARMGETFMKEAIAYAKVSCRDKYRNMRLEGSAKRCLDSIFNDFVGGYIREFAAEAWNAGQQARQKAEEISRVIIESRHKNLSYEVYRPLSCLWRLRRSRAMLIYKSFGGEDMGLKMIRMQKQRQAQLKQMMQIWIARGFDPLDFSPEALEQLLKNEAASRQKEIKNRNREVKDMRHEEELTRKFNFWELMVQLNTRRAMAIEDLCVRAQIEMEQKLAQMKFDKSAIEAELERDTFLSEKLAQRERLKVKMVESLKMDREIIAMEFEDNLAKTIRLEQRMREANDQKAMEDALLGGNDLDMYGVDVRDFCNSDSEETDSTTDSDSDIEQIKKRHLEENNLKMDARVGIATRIKRAREKSLFAASKDHSRFDMPDIVGPISTDTFTAYDFKPLYQILKDAPDIHRLIRRRMTNNRIFQKDENLPGAVRRAVKKLRVAAEELHGVCMQREELNTNVLKIEEEAKLCEWRSSKVEKNYKKLKAENLSIASRELKVRKAKEKSILSLEEADCELEIAGYILKKKKKKARTLNQKLIFMRREAEYFSTSVFHGYMVQMETEKVEPKLHLSRFESIVDSIVLKAEVSCLERALTKVCQHIRLNSDVISKQNDRIVLMRREFDREQRLLLRRSALGQQIFGKWQLSIVRVAFEGWANLQRWSQNIKQQYTLRYTVLNQTAQLNRWREDLRTDKERRSRGEGYYNDQKVGRKGGQSLSMMQKFQRRVVKCIYCKQTYKEVLNNEMACSYHPGKYILDCPETCKHRGAGSSRPTSCMAHYRWRWSCCDVEEDAPFMTNGCKRRWHRRTTDLELREQRAKLEAKEMEEDAVNIAWDIKASIPSDKARIKDLNRMKEITMGNIEARKFKQRYKVLKNNTHYAQKMKRIESEQQGE